MNHLNRINYLRTRNKTASVLDQLSEMWESMSPSQQRAIIGAAGGGALGGGAGYLMGGGRGALMGGIGGAGLGGGLGYLSGQERERLLDEQAGLEGQFEDFQNMTQQQMEQLKAEYDNQLMAVEDELENNANLSAERIAQLNAARQALEEEGQALRTWGRRLSAGSPEELRAAADRKDEEARARRAQEREAYFGGAVSALGDSTRDTVQGAATGIRDAATGIAPAAAGAGAGYFGGGAAAKSRGLGSGRSALLGLGTAGVGGLLGQSVSDSYFGN